MIFLLVRKNKSVKCNINIEQTPEKGIGLNVKLFLPDAKHMRRTFSVWSQFSALLEHDKKFVEADPHSTSSIKNGISGSDHSSI